MARQKAPTFQVPLENLEAEQMVLGSSHIDQKTNKGA